MEYRVLLLTGNAQIARKLNAGLPGKLVVDTSWPVVGASAYEVIVVDLATLSESSWQALELLSRRPHRPAIILLDDRTAPRDRLAKVLADDLIWDDAPCERIAARVAQRTTDYAFRSAAAEIRTAPSIPYPLSIFLATGLTEGFTRVGALARSLDISQSTVRDQWRRHRRHHMRLEDILHLAHEVRRRASGWGSSDWVDRLTQLVHLITNEHPPKGRLGNEHVMQEALTVCGPNSENVSNPKPREFTAHAAIVRKEANST